MYLRCISTRLRYSSAEELYLSRYVIEHDIEYLKDKSMKGSD